MKFNKLFLYFINFFSFFYLKISFSIGKLDTEEVLCDFLSDFDDYEDFKKKMNNNSLDLDSLINRIIQMTPAYDLYVSLGYEKSSQLIKNFYDYFSKNNHKISKKYAFQLFQKKNNVKYPELQNCRYEEFEILENGFNLLQKILNEKDFEILNNKKYIKSHCNLDINLSIENTKKELFTIFKVDHNGGDLSINLLNYQLKENLLPVFLSYDGLKMGASGKELNEDFLYVIIPGILTDIGKDVKFLHYFNAEKFFKNTREFLIAAKKEARSKSLYIAVPAGMEYLIKGIISVNKIDKHLFSSGVEVDGLDILKIDLSSLNALPGMMKKSLLSLNKKKNKKIIIQVNLLEEKIGKDRNAFESRLFSKINSIVPMNFDIGIQYIKDKNGMNNVVFGNCGLLLDSKNRKYAFKEGLKIDKKDSKLKESLSPQEVYSLGNFFDEEKNIQVEKFKSDIEKCFSINEYKEKIQELLNELKHDFFITLAQSEKNSIILDKESLENFIESLIVIASLDFTNKKKESEENVIRFRDNLKDSFKYAFVFFSSHMISNLYSKNIFMVDVDPKDFQSVLANHSIKEFIFSSKVFLKNMVDQIGYGKRIIPCLFLPEEYKKNLENCSDEKFLNNLLDVFNKLTKDEIENSFYFGIHSDHFDSCTEALKVDFDMNVNLDKKNLLISKDRLLIPFLNDNHNYIFFEKLFKENIKNKDNFKKIVDCFNEIYIKNKVYFDSIFDKSILTEDEQKQRDKNIIFLILYRILHSPDKISFFDLLKDSNSKNIEKKLLEVKSINSESMEVSKGIHKEVIQGGLLIPVIPQKGSGVNFDAIPYYFKTWYEELEVIGNACLDEKREVNRDKINTLTKHLRKIDSLYGSPGSGKTVGFLYIMNKTFSYLKANKFDKYIKLKIYNINGLKNSYVNGGLVIMNNVDRFLAELNTNTQKEGKQLVPIFFVDEPEQFFQDEKKIDGNSSASLKELTGGLKALCSKYFIHLVVCSNKTEKETKAMLTAPLCDRIKDNGAQFRRTYVSPRNFSLIVKERDPNINWTCLKRELILWAFLSSSDSKNKDADNEGDALGGRAMVAEIITLLKEFDKNNKIISPEERDLYNASLIQCELRKRNHNTVSNKVMSLTDGRDENSKDQLVMEDKKNIMQGLGSQIGSWFGPAISFVSGQTNFAKDVYWTIGTSLGIGSLINLVRQVLAEKNICNSPAWFFKESVKKEPVKDGQKDKKKEIWKYIYYDDESYNINFSNASIWGRINSIILNPHNYFPLLSGALLQVGFHFGMPEGKHGQKVFAHIGRLLVRSENSFYKEKEAEFSLKNSEKLKDNNISLKTAQGVMKSINTFTRDGFDFKEKEHLLSSGLRPHLFSGDFQDNNFLHEHKRMLDLQMLFNAYLIKEVLNTNDYPEIKKICFAFESNSEDGFDRIGFFKLMTTIFSFDVREKKLLCKDLLTKVNDECKKLINAPDKDIISVLNEYKGIRKINTSEAEQKKLEIMNGVLGMLKQSFNNVRFDINVFDFNSSFIKKIFNYSCVSPTIKTLASKENFFSEDEAERQERTLIKIVLNSYQNGLPQSKMEENLDLLFEKKKKDILLEYLKDKNKKKEEELSENESQEIKNIINMKEKEKKTFLTEWLTVYCEAIK